MRRGAPSSAVRVDPSNAPRWGRVAHGPRGLGLGAAPVPEGVSIADGPAWHPVYAAPFAVTQAVVVAGGDIVLVASPGVARTLRAPSMQQAFDRRPPGLDRVAGASRSNAGLLHADDGWRAVVLPSLGDVLPDLGPGPAALRPDGRVVAAVRDGGIVELGLPGGEEIARHPGEPDALAYVADGTLVVALGVGVGAPGGSVRAGSPVVALAAAAEAPVVLARHADGSCSLWEGGADQPVGTWTPPFDGPLSISLSPDGALAGVGTPFADPAGAAVVDARSGAVLLAVEGARAVALAPEGVVIGGEWGVMWLAPVDEEESQS